MAYDKSYSCGQPLENEQTGRRIVNGKNVAPPHANPWMVTVSKHKYGSNSQSSYGCGGTLISRKHVLSAVHCAIRCQNNTDKCKSKPVNWATLGDYDKRKNDGEVFVPIRRPYYTHKKARQKQRPYGAFKYDYVIFALECCITFNSYIQPACFPTESVSNIVGKKVRVLGWGKTKHEGSPSPTLKYVDIEVLSHKLCEQRNRRKGSIAYKKKYLMCAADPDHWDKDACQNDSGGMY